MCGPSVGAAPPFAVRLRYHDINLRSPRRDRNGAEREMEAFDHVATNDDTNRQVGRLNYFPLCRAVQVAFKTAVSRKEGRMEGPSVTQNACTFLPSSLRLSL